MTRSFAAALLLFATAGGVSPESRPDFSGRWKMNPGKSHLQTALPDSTLFRIEHREPTFKLTRTHNVKGVADTFSIALTTDGKEVVTRDGERVIHSRCAWDGPRLVFDSRIVLKDVEATNLVTYSLSADGMELTAVEHFRSPGLTYDNLWVFDRE